MQRRLTVRLPGAQLASRLSWAFVSYGSNSAVRIIGNVVLTRLLAPQIFGIMVIVNTLRTGMELLSDIGVGQSIVADRRGEDPDFYATAWTLQVARGLILTVLFALAAIPLAALYGGGILLPVMQVSALFLLITGFQSVGRYIALRQQRLRRLALLEIGVQSAVMAAQVALAWVWPTVWALVIGALIGAIMTTLASYRIVPGLVMRFRVHRPSVHAIVHFSKWIFLSSIVYFAASNFDRLYLGTVVPLAVLGVFGIARGLADVFASLINQLGNMVLFPAIAQARLGGVDIRTKLGELRAPLLAAAGFLIAALIAVSDTLVTFLYDARYHDAAFMLPVLAGGLWFTVLATVGEAVLLGIGRPVYAALANSAKFAWLIAMVPIGIGTAGITGAVLAIALGDLIRYLVLLFGQARERLAFGVQDLALTAAFVATAVGLREATGAVGLSSGLTEWWPALAGLAG